MNELLHYQAERIERILAAQGLQLRIVGGTVGPRLVVFQAVKPASVKLSAVMRMDEEIALGLGVPACRIARNGRYLAIEIPRQDSETVRLLRLIDRVPPRPSTAVVGVDEEGTSLLLPLDSPNIGHVLICGTTGSGKTALARSMIAGLALHHAVFELSLVLIDPKRRGYVPFAGLPHLVHPVIHEPEGALGALAWAMAEMERRDHAGARGGGGDLETWRPGEGERGRSHPLSLSPPLPVTPSPPLLVIFIDELADLMLVGGEEVEILLTRLVQRGREAGVHVVACTQKPTTAVIGSLVKANFPCRIVGRVTDTNDAYVATGISGTGAERLLGRGDFLVVAGGDVVRMQGAYISEAEIEELVTKLRGGRPLLRPGDKETRRQGDKGTRRQGEGEKEAREEVTPSPPHLLTPSPLLPLSLSQFVDRYRERRNGGAGADREPHNKTPPTEAMIAFALEQLKEHGEVSQRAVQRFHKDKYGTLCNTRRAQAAIEAAQQRYRNRNSSSGAQQRVQRPD